MANRGENKDYKFGPKNHWRRTIWNDVLRRTEGRHMSQPIIYLAGPQDLDRDVATSKGVPGVNLIAVDRSRANVSRIKAKGASAIDAELIDVLRAWPSSRPISALVLDFCHGLEMAVLWSLLNILNRIPFSDTVVAVNFMRGRDASSGELRRHIAASGRMMKALSSHAAVKFMTEDSRSDKSRAFQYFMTYFASYIVLYTSAGMSESDPRLESMLQQVMIRSNPSVISYRSGPLVFDSLVYKTVSIDTIERLGHISFPHDKNQRIESALAPADTNIARRVSAMLAVRTHRIRMAS